MGFIGFIGMCFCIAMTFETNNTDFLILAGLIFIGTCILELPRMIFNKIQKLTDYKTTMSTRLKK